MTGDAAADKISLPEYAKVVKEQVIERAYQMIRSSLADSIAYMSSYRSNLMSIDEQIT